MSNCFYEKCGKEIEQTEGQKPKKFCDALCRQRDYNSRNPSKGFVRISKEKYLELLEGVNLGENTISKANTQLLS